jgi:hypothetical protein
LWLRGYRPKKYHDLSRFKAIDKLEHLHIALSNIKTLKGIEALHVLRELALSYCRSLEDISELSENTATLQELQIDRCKKARNLEMMLKKLKQLRKIILSHCRDLPSLKFVKQLPKLEFLSFVDTNVLDGDITPCLNLKFVGFMNKRHFSHTFEEVRSIIEKRTNEQNLYSK